jgi:hypothetical protein
MAIDPIRLLVFMLGLAGATPFVVLAQGSRDGEPLGHFVTVPTTGVGSAPDQCLALGDDTYGSDVREVGACHAGGVTSLGAAAGRRWAYRMYERRWLLPGSGTTAADTVAETEIVLFATADSVLVPVWHYRFEPDMLRSVTPEVADTPDGGALFAIDECVNGTGGCSQAFFAYRAGKWRAIKTVFLDSLNRRYPGAVAHGFHVNVRTLQADAALYSAGDANCCPSRSAEMKLRLRGDALEIVSLRTRPTAVGDPRVPRTLNGPRRSALTFTIWIR